MSTSADPTILVASDVRIIPDVQPTQLTIRQGEIIGLAGLDGHGQDRFLKTLAGLYDPISGRVEVTLPDGSKATINNLREAAKAGVAYLPRERKTEGIMPVLSVYDNFAVGTLAANARFGFVNKKAMRAKLDKMRERLSMVYASPKAPITSLSGGNQQKVLLARWMAASPRVMLLNDPTRGVDMATKLTLYQVFREMAAEEKTALVLLSTEIEEFIQLCDRTLVFHAQSMFRELDKAATTRANITAAMFGRAQNG